MVDKKFEYDRFAKQLWVKVYQDILQDHSNEEAKDTADLALADYVNSIHGEATLQDLHETKYNGKPLELLIDKKPVSEILKEQSVDTNNMIELQFELDCSDDIMLEGGYYHLCHYLNFVKKCDQTRIKRIWLEMKGEDE